MKKILFAASAFALVMVSSLALIPKDAEAIPVFARKYGMACASCHTMFPKLTKMGVAFRERGFRFAAGRDDIEIQDERGKNYDAGGESPAAVFAAAFPFTVRTQIFYSGAGPIEADDGVAVMPGHRPGMLDGASENNPKIGFGELGLISSGSYDDFSWWLDANLDGIGMLEGIYYVNDLLKVRLGRVQNNVGYGMTMMSHRPLGYGWNDAAQMAGGTMLMMADGISIQGTTNGDSGVGTSYNLTYGTFGTNDNQNGEDSTSLFGRIAQEIMGNHIIGVYGYRATNYSSDAFGGEASMLMAMGAPGATIATAMQFKDVTRYGIDFAINYGEPLQLWGAYTTGENTSFASGQKLKVDAFTVSGEWKVADAWMIGTKYDSSEIELQMGTATILKPEATTHATLYGIHQLAENVQAILSYTRSSDVVERMGIAAGATNATVSNFNSVLFALDIAL